MGVIDGTRTSGGAESNEPTLKPTMTCLEYLDCAAVAVPDLFAEVLERFGPSGSCWLQGPLEAMDCDEQCSTRLAELQETLGLECKPPADSCDSGPTHELQIQPIWTANCVEGCHEAGGVWQFVDLSPGSAYDALVEHSGTFGQAAGLLLVESGSPETSLLAQKLRGTQPKSGGQAMPLQPDGAPAPLPEAEIALIERWIECGAVR